MSGYPCLRCARCGNALLVDLTAVGVVPVEHGGILFRRNTDYVMCSSCLASYPVQRLVELGSQLEASTFS